MAFLTRTHGMGIAAAALGISVLCSRLLGLARDKIISYYFGAGTEADIYFTAFVVPDFLNYLLAGGYFSVTLVPLLARAFSGDEREGWRFFSAAVCWAGIAISVLTVAAWIHAPRISALVAPGFSPAAGERLALFLRIILPAQICFLPGACFTAMLYHRRQFAVPALSPLAYNGCIILGGLVWLHAFPDRGMEGFCWGVLAGAALGGLILPVLAVRAGGLRLGPALFHPYMKKLVILALPLMLGQSIVALDEQFVRIFGSLAGEGAVSLLSYARRIMLVPVGVVAQAAGVASYPFLAALAASGERDKFASSLNQALSNTLLVALPLSLSMIACAGPIMRLIFQQGEMTVQAASEAGLLLAVMLAGVGLWAVQQVLGRAFYAHEDTVTPALVGTAATLGALPVYWLGVRLLGAAGVALAGVWGLLLYTAGLCLLWRRRFGRGALYGLSGKVGGALLAGAPSCAAAYGAALAAGSLLPEFSLGGAACAAAAGGAAFVLTYVCCCLLFSPHLGAPLTAFAAGARRRFLR
jgi:putative peptidoglycan lipid II flippase